MSISDLKDESSARPGTAGIAPSRFQGLKRWTPILAKFLSIQLIVQILGMVVGLILVRRLSQREYAYYTLANTMQATLMMLADVGVCSALTSVGGKVWQDYRRFGELIQTGLQTRKTLAWASISVALPTLVWLLRHNHAPWFTVLTLSFAVLLGAWLRLTSDILGIVPSLHAQIDRLQKLDFAGAILRFAGVVAMYFVYLNSSIAVFVQSIVFGVQNWYLRRWMIEGADPTAPQNAEDRKTIYRVIRQQAPTTIYSCIQGQLTVFLISCFGTTRTVAEIGALGRVAVFFTILGTVMYRIVLPRFARCQDRSRLIQIWWRIIGIYLTVAVIMVAAAAFLPAPFMWLLGSKYSFARTDLAWVVLGTVVSTYAGAVYQMITTRAWVSGIWIAIPITIGTQLALFHFLDLGTVRGVVLFSVLPVGLAMIPWYFTAYKGFKSVDADLGKKTEDTPSEVESDL